MKADSPKPVHSDAIGVSLTRGEGAAPAEFELRLHRTFKWVRAPHGPGEEVFYGGPPRPLVLDHTDTLQFRRAGGDWQDVPVVEAEKPPKPEQRDRFGRSY